MMLLQFHAASRAEEIPFLDLTAAAGAAVGRGFGLRNRFRLRFRQNDRLRLLLRLGLLYRGGRSRRFGHLQCFFRCG